MFFCFSLLGWFSERSCLGSFRGLCSILGIYKVHRSLWFFFCMGGVFSIMIRLCSGRVLVSHRIHLMSTGAQMVVQSAPQLWAVLISVHRLVFSAASDRAQFFCALLGVVFSPIVEALRFFRNMQFVTRAILPRHAGPDMLGPARPSCSNQFTTLRLLGNRISDSPKP